MDFVHEAAHAEFHHFQISEFIQKASTKKPDSKSMKKLIRNLKYSGYGKSRLLRVLELAREAYPENSIDELMAVEAEFKELREAGFSEDHKDFKSEGDYARWHLLNDLAWNAQSRPLSSKEKKTFLRAVFDNLVNGGEGELQKQFQHGKKLAELLEKIKGEKIAVPDFKDIRLKVFQQQETEKKVVIVAGITTLSSGLILALYFTLGKSITLFTNETINPTSPADENEDDEKRKKN